MSSLRSRLTVAALVWAAFGLVLGTLVMSADVAGRVDRAIDEDLAKRFADVSAAVRSGAYEVIKADPLAQVVTLDGTVVASSILPGQQALLRPDEVVVARTSPVTADHGAVRVHAERQGDHIVVVGTSAEARIAIDHRRRVLLGVVVPVLVLLAGLGAWLLVGATLRPVTTMVTEAERLSVQDPGRRLAEPRGDTEVARLAASLNHLLDRVEETLAAERAFVDDASHELRTPLGVLQGELELAQMQLGELELARGHAGGELGEVGELREVESEGSPHADALAGAIDSVGRAHHEAQRLGRLTADMLTLARLDRGEIPMQRRAVDLRGLADEVCDRVGRTRPTVEVAGSTVLANVDRDRIDQVLANLVVNARRHAVARVSVVIDDLGSRGATVTVADDGPGIPERLLPHLFDRFKRAEASRRRSRGAADESGAGLGMAIVASIVAAHRGTISVANGAPLGGAAVTVTLPIDVSGHDGASTTNVTA